MQGNGHGESRFDPELERGLIEAALREAGELDSASAAAIWPDASLALTESLPGYRVTKRMHSGGQGVVFQAVQESTQRTVAIKVMRDGALAADNDRLRFEREMQILSQLNHPSIVTIHDRGSLNGSSYFVMDYIAGQQLDRYIARRDKSIKDTLRLFAKICEAVHAAHLQGVIHRDLKPANIRLDAQGNPHILDFGLAKMTASEAFADPNAHSMTHTGQFVGSCPWASPEQADGGGKIDIRTDVYSLGVVLFQMLTGQFPYPVMGRMRDVLDNIIATDPARPRALNRAIDDEVETIVLKCLAKSPERRYQSAGELARDVHRYLDGEPIEAKRDSTWYVLRKTLKKRVFPATVTALLLAFGIVFTWNVYLERLRDRRQTNEQQVLSGILSFFDEDKAKSDEELRADVRRIDDVTFTDVLVEAKVRSKVGNFYRDRGLYGEAKAQILLALDIRAAQLGEHSAEVAETQDDLANVYWFMGEYPAAKELFEKALATRNELLGERSAEAAISLNGLAATLDKMGDHAEAEQLYRRVMDIRGGIYPAEHELIAAIKNNLATCLLEQGKFEEAEALLREAVEMIKRLQGDSHPQYAKGLHTLARCELAMGRDEDAERHLLDAIERKRFRLGKEHDSVATSLIVLAELKLKQNKPAGSEPLAREAVAILERTFPAGHRRIDNAQVVVGRALMEQGRLDEAEAVLVRACENLATRAGYGDADTVAAVRQLVSVYESAGDDKKAGQYREKLPPDPS